MTGAQLYSGVPLVGISLVLILFAISAWARARRNRQRCCPHYWPLSWDELSALFLASLSGVAATGAFRAFAHTPDLYELWAVRAALWTALVVSIWTFWRWSRE